MARTQTTQSQLRQRNKAAREQAEAAAVAAQAADDAPLTPGEKASYYAAQHGGFVLCALGIGLLGFGYDREWMSNMALCMLSLGLCCVGLLFHELRPFNVSGAARRGLVTRASRMLGCALACLHDSPMRTAARCSWGQANRAHRRSSPALLPAHAALWPHRRPAGAADTGG